MIVANNLNQDGAGFGTDTNIVTFYKKDGNQRACRSFLKMKWQEKY